MKKICLLLMLLVSFAPHSGSAASDGPFWSWVSAPTLMDINNDGTTELVYNRGGQLYAYNNKGILPGYPKISKLNPYSTPTIVDLNSDGKKEIIGVCDKNKICIYDTDGAVFHGWPQKVSGHVVSSPAVADIDKDGLYEIVVGTDYSGSKSTKVYIFRQDGSLMTGWPKDVMAGVAANPVIADINGDGSLDIVVATLDGTIHVWDKDGHNLPGWPKFISGKATDFGSIYGSSPAVADLNNDGTKEIVVCDSTGHIFVLKADGSILKGWPQTAGHSIQFSSPSIGDVNGDGKLEIAVGSFDGKVYLWKADGTIMPGWPQATQGPVYASPVLIDIDQDGKLEVAAGSTDNKVYIWQANGNLLAGWPQTISEKSLNSLAFGDFDNNGKLDLLAVTDNKVNTWKFANTTTLPWSIPRYDQQRTGFYSYKKNDAEIIVYKQPVAVAIGTSVTLKVKVTNNGLDVWKNGYDVLTKTLNKNAYDCRAHLYDAKGKLLVWDLFMSGNDFPKDVKPGETAWLTFTVPTTGKNASITQTGSYMLGVDVVHENVAWFNQEVKTNIFKVQKNNDAAIVILQQPNSVKIGNAVTLTVKVTNNGFDVWKHNDDKNGSYACRAHLYDSKGNLKVWDLFLRGKDLGKDVKPGETVTLSFSVPVEKSSNIPAGTYSLGVDMVHEKVAWFNQIVKTNTFIVK
ncbi:MAG: VCBS repeat-containing protein [Candidatus Omnitrophica bacterium]|nr:VCBS repeat-containing protein [Candidatus Omnitrophota bacterium]